MLKINEDFFMFQNKKFSHYNFENQIFFGGLLERKISLKCCKDNKNKINKSPSMNKFKKITLFVFHFEISGKDNNDEYPGNI